MACRLLDAPFDPSGELATFAQGRTDVGAVVSFTGITRDDSGDLLYLEIEHYPAMTLPALEAIEARARARWDLKEVLILHRHGQMKPGEVIMMVATASPHRRDAFEAADFLMDYLKSRAPFWKKEVTSSGATWVAAKDQDEDDLNRW